jgi:hypothetical protein
MKKIKVTVEISFRMKEEETIIVYDNGDSFPIIDSEGKALLGFPECFVEKAFEYRRSYHYLSSFFQEKHKLETEMGIDLNELQRHKIETEFEEEKKESYSSSSTDDWFRVGW